MAFPIPSNSIYSSGEKNYTYISGVNDSCIKFRMEPECDTEGEDELGRYTINRGNSTDDDFFKGLIAQSITCSCARQPTIVYEIGTKNYYAVDAKPQGQGRLQNILGPTRESVETLKILGDICQPTRISITIVPCSCFCHKDIDKPSPLTEETSLIFTGGFLTNVTLSATAKDLVVQGSWDFLFQDLQLA